MQEPSFEQVLAEPFPRFLVALQTTNTSAAIADFAECARKWLENYPTRSMRRLHQDEREDVTSAVITRLIDDDAARLRGYQDRGRPFYAWLMTVVDRHCISRQRSKRLRGEVSLSHLEKDADAADGKPDIPILIDIVWQHAQKLDVECLLALIAHFVDGWDARDLVFILGRASTENKQVSDRVRYCRQALAKLLFDSGFRREDFL